MSKHAISTYLTYTCTLAGPEDLSVTLQTIAHMLPAGYKMVLDKAKQPAAAVYANTRE